MIQVSCIIKETTLLWKVTEYLFSLEIHFSWKAEEICVLYAVRMGHVARKSADHCMPVSRWFIFEEWSSWWHGCFEVKPLHFIAWEFVSDPFTQQIISSCGTADTVEPSPLFILSPLSNLVPCTLTSAACEARLIFVRTEPVIMGLNYES